MRVVLFLVAALGLASPLQAQTPKFEVLPDNAGSEGMSEFQWFIYNGGGLVLVPGENGSYLPARLAGDGIIETLPVKVKVELYGTGKTASPALSSVLSPFEMVPEKWRLETRDGESWRRAPWFLFHDSKFYALTSGSFEPQEPGNIRFVKRGSN